MSSETVASSKKRLTRISDHSDRPSRRGSWKIAKDLPSSFRYASQGLIYACASQRNFRIHISLGIIALSMALWLGIDSDDLAILILTVSAVLVLELINTSIEAVVDLAIGRRYHPLARIAKDSSAGAVLIAALCSLCVAFCLLLPPFFLRMGF
tara:strand:+ start:3066 stop:3524 length:459 start_codon:yes stop_codon:yes gene_type:complete